MRRRRQIGYHGKQRLGNNSTDRTRDRHRVCVRCQSRIRVTACLCDSEHEINSFFYEREWNKLVKFQKSCPVRTYDDCYDGNDFRKYMDNRRQDSVCSNLIKCWAYVRHQWPPTWEVLKLAFLARGRPDLEKYEEILKGLYTSGATVNNGNFRKLHVNFYRVKSGGVFSEWTSAADMKPWVRDRVAVECGWNAVCATKAACVSYEKYPTSETFARLIRTWQEQLRQRVIGRCGPYTIKRCLDLLVVGGIVQRRHVSLWPAECPGYKMALLRLFPGLPPRSFEHALFFLLRRWPNAQGLFVGEIAMMLCWWTAPKCSSRLLCDVNEYGTKNRRTC